MAHRMIAVLAIASFLAQDAAASKMDEGWATAALIKSAETGNTKVIEGILQKSGEFKAGFSIPNPCTIPLLPQVSLLGALRGQPIHTTGRNALASNIPCSEGILLNAASFRAWVICAKLITHASPACVCRGPSHPVIASSQIGS